MQEKQFSQVVALDDGRYLRDEDDDLLSLANMLHCSCQGVFKQALKTNPRAAVTAGRILESAYLWVVACRSCKFSGLEFEGLLVRFQCQKTSSPATSFRRTARCSTLPKLQRCRTPLSVMPRGTIRVPIFKNDTGALYLVDMGGTGNMSKALNKVQKMSDVLVKEGLREDLQVSKLQGVVLLPNIVSIGLENEGIISEAITVTGTRARELLGGLVQLLAWMPAV